MPRRRAYREDGPGAAFHLTARVNWQSWLLEPERNRAMLLRETERALEAFDVELIAYALMGNHYHLVVASPPDPIYSLRAGRRTPCRHFRPWPPKHPNASVMAQFRRQLSRMSARAIQRELKVTGHLWEGPSYARPLEDVADLLGVIAYDHFNAVKAGASELPETYPWSSAAWWAEAGGAVLPILRHGRVPFGLTIEDLRYRLLELGRSPKFLAAIAKVRAEDLDPQTDEGREFLLAELHASGAFAPTSPPEGDAARVPHSPRVTT
jgi:REP element-mobilizing transposase RayT